MNVCLLIRQRLAQLGLEQKDLAAAAEVTESYISQLLTRKKLPPAPDRTDIYAKISEFLKLPSSELSRLAALERVEKLKRELEVPPAPLFKDIRELILRKCTPEKREQIRGIFEKDPFGEFERLITQKLLDVVKRAARQELENENWVHLVARLSGHSYEQTRVMILEFLDADVFNLAVEHCISFLDPLIESWDLDLTTFSMEIVLNRRVAPGPPQKFAFVETAPDESSEEPGLKEFLKNNSLSSGISDEELEFLRKLKFNGKHPKPLYYYRELQNLRDPLHFSESSIAPMHKRRDADGVEKQLQGDSRKRAVERWAKNKNHSRNKAKSKPH